MVTTRLRCADQDRSQGHHLADRHLRQALGARHDRASGTHRPLTVTAVALLADGADPLVILTADLAWWRRSEDERRVREPLLARLGLPEGRLLFNGDHSHGCRRWPSAPSVSRSPWS